MSIHIISDSTCDLPARLTSEFDISILPLHVLLGEDDRLDGVNVTPEELYEWSDKNNTTPKTAAPSPDEAITLMESILKEDPEAEFVCFSISAPLSSSNNVMHMAAEELDLTERTRVIDSMSLSNGVAFLAIYASTLVKEGKTLDEIEAAVKEVIPRLKVSFVVDTLTYLHRGGRCGGLAALMGTKLKLHPKIVVEDGLLHAEKKYRGNMNKVIKDYTDDLDASLKKAYKNLVFLVHSGCDQELVDTIYDHIKNVSDFKRIETDRAGSVISSHCGPGTLGILFIEGE